MCGIVGYVGFRNASEFLLEGLRRLEYRGYDSAGLAVMSSRRNFHVIKSVGRIAGLSQLVEQAAPQGTTGIGHTRWATHGPATEENAHPHFGGDRVAAIVHNGVIENYQSIKERLEVEGYCFRSATDTEAIAHLIAACLEIEERKGPAPEVDPYRHLVNAMKAALGQAQGTYGLVAMF